MIKSFSVPHSGSLLIINNITDVFLIKLLAEHTSTARQRVLAWIRLDP